jgi:hypothetical protein
LWVSFASLPGFAVPIPAITRDDGDSGDLCNPLLVSVYLV